MLTLEGIQDDKATKPLKTYVSDSLDKNANKGYPYTLVPMAAARRLKYCKKTLSTHFRGWKPRNHIYLLCQFAENNAECLPYRSVTSTIGCGGSGLYVG
jgi:hypothetical protein